MFSTSVIYIYICDAFEALQEECNSQHFISVINQ